MVGCSYPRCFHGSVSRPCSPPVRFPGIANRDDLGARPKEACVHGGRDFTCHDTFRGRPRASMG